ncbi:hypothetical protein BH10CYA1_BH10CYA1_34700 [soil metagenome]
MLDAKQSFRLALAHVATRVVGRSVAQPEENSFLGREPEAGSAFEAAGILHLLRVGHDAHHRTSDSGGDGDDQMTALAKVEDALVERLTGSRAAGFNHADDSRPGVFALDAQPVATSCFALSGGQSSLVR